MDKDKTYTICYDSLSVFENKEDAKNFYTSCYYCSEGAEQSRYSSVLVDLMFSDLAKDNVSECVRDIYIHSKNYETPIKINLDSHSTFTDAIDYYKNSIEPIITICDDYDIDFNSDIPFEDFGNDEESVYGRMRSISNFYNDILKKFNIEVNNIITKDRSDGKYIVVINNDKEFDVNSWDNIENVIENVESMILELKEKEIEV